MNENVTSALQRFWWPVRQHHIELLSHWYKCWSRAGLLHCRQCVYYHNIQLVGITGNEKNKSLVLIPKSQEVWKSLEAIEPGSFIHSVRLILLNSTSAETMQGELHQKAIHIFVCKCCKSHIIMICKIKTYFVMIILPFRLLLWKSIIDWLLQ